MGKNKYKIGDKINGYTIFDADSKRKGGNGRVYFVKKNNSNYALKYIIFDYNTKFKRFKREISVVKDKLDVEGVLKIYDSYIPYKFNKNSEAWYIMDIAEPINIDNFSKKSTKTIVENLLFVAKTLQFIHTKDITHRDIKPENLLFHNDKIHISDFGLVNYPGAIEITRESDRIGPWTTIAPEFKRNAKFADGKKGDVYSFAKTLWILLTGVKESFDGQYSYKDDKIRLMTYREKIDQAHQEFQPLAILDRLLIEATENQPEKRISMDKVIEYLNDFLSTTFDEKINYEWKFISEILFPYGVPSSAYWTKSNDIVKILKELTYFKNLNHLFFSNGGLDLTDVKLSDEPNFIELNFNGLISKLSPKSLIFESFDNSEWNYFLLENKKLDFENSNIMFYKGATPVVEVQVGKYIPSWCWEYGRNMLSPFKEKLSENSRRIELCSDSKYVIFNKRSKYNKESSTYNGYQNFLSNEDFKFFISKCIENHSFYFETIKKAYFVSNKFSKEKQSFFMVNAIKNPEIFWSNLHTYKNNKLSFDVKDTFGGFFIESFFNKINLNFQENSNKGNIFYEMSITFDEDIYIILEDNTLKKKESNSFFNDFICDENKKFNKIAALLVYEQITKLANDFGFSERIYCSIEDITVDKIPNRFLTKTELNNILLNGDSFVRNTLVIDETGKLELLPNKNNKFKISLYPVQINNFSAYNNDVGEFYNERYLALDYRYEEVLNYYYEFLSTMSVVIYVDYFQFPIEILEKKIFELIK